MEHTHQLPVRRYFSELALEAVWIVDEPTGNDAEHVQALSRAGFGFSGGRFLVQANWTPSVREGVTGTLLWDRGTDRYEFAPGRNGRNFAEHLTLVS